MFTRSHKKADKQLNASRIDKQNTLCKQRLQFQRLLKNFNVASQQIKGHGLNPCLDVFV